MLRRLLPALLGLALALGCAGSGLAQQALRLGIPERDNLQYLSLWTALGAGYFKDEGLDVAVVYAPASNASGQLLIQNLADVALLQPPVYMGLIAQERPILLFANLLANDPINLIVRRDVAEARKLDPKAPLAARLAALKGLRIGVAPEPPRRLRVLFASVGMNADRDIQMVTVPGRGQVQALAEGRVDALYAHTPYLEASLVDLGAVLLVNQSSGEVADLTGGQIHSMATTRAFAESKPDVVLAVTRAIARAERLIRSDPQATLAAIMRSGIAAPSERHVATILEFYRRAVPDTPAVSAAAVARNVVLYPARPAAPDLTHIRVTDYLAPRFAEEAAAGLR